MCLVSFLKHFHAVFFAEFGHFLERLGVTAPGKGWVHRVPVDAVRSVLREHRMPT